MSDEGKHEEPAVEVEMTTGPASSNARDVNAGGDDDGVSDEPAKSPQVATAVASDGQSSVPSASIVPGHDDEGGGGGRAEPQLKSSSRIANLPSRVRSMTQQDISGVFDDILHPPPMDDNVGGGDRGHCCHIKDNILRNVEYAFHCAVSIAVLSAIVFYTPDTPQIPFGDSGFFLTPRYIIASTPFLLPLAGIMTTGASLGNAILKTVIVLWALLVGLVVVSVATLPLHCSPIAQASAFFFIMWFTRYWLSFLGAPTNSKFITAVHLLGALISVQSSVLTGTCDYSSWPLLLLAYVSFAISSTVAFLASFCPWPRFNFLDSAQLNRRVLRDSVRMVKAAASVLLLTYHRPEEDDGDRSDPSCTHAKIDRAEVCLACLACLACLECLAWPGWWAGVHCELTAHLH